MRAYSFRFCFISLILLISSYLITKKKEKKKRTKECKEKKRFFHRTFWIVLLPNFIVHVVIFVGQAFLHIFLGLRIVFQDDRNVHVDDDQKRNDQIRYQIGDRNAFVAAIAGNRIFDVDRFRTDQRLIRSDRSRGGQLIDRFGQIFFAIAVLIVHDGGQHAVPAGRRAHLKQQNERFEERAEVERVVESVALFHVHEEAHAENGVDEHDQEEQQTNVEQGRQAHGQRKQQRTNATRSFDQSQHSTDLDHSNDSQQGRRYEYLGYPFLQYGADDGQDDLN